MQQAPLRRRALVVAQVRVGVDFDDGQNLGADLIGPHDAVRGADMRKGEPGSAGCNDGWCQVLWINNFGDDSHVCDVGFPTVPYAAVHNTTAIVTASRNAAGAA